MTTMRRRVAAQLHEAAEDAHRVANKGAPGLSDDGGFEAIKAELREEFPAWSIIRSKPDGRWWAMRGPKGGKVVQHGASCFEASTPEGLRVELLGSTNDDRGRIWGPGTRDNGDLSRVVDRHDARPSRP